MARREFVGDSEIIRNICNAAGWDELPRNGEVIFAWTLSKLAKLLVWRNYMDYVCAAGAFPGAAPTPMSSGDRSLVHQATAITDEEGVRDWGFY